MSFPQSSQQLVRAARSIYRPRPRPALADFYESFSRLCFCHVRTYKSRYTTPSQRDIGSIAKSSTKELGSLTTMSSVKEVKELREKSLTVEERQEAAAKRARDKLKADQAKQVANSQKLGSLASNSLFAEDEDPQSTHLGDDAQKNKIDSISPLANRNLANMEVALNPRPNARARWQRRMVIRDIRHRGRISKKMEISRTERSHLSRSHFFKTSMKKLAPLARQIAGKSIDEAILQMRFSTKKAARDVKEHLITARNEAVVARGMGLPIPDGPVTAAIEAEDPSIVPALPTQKSTKSLIDKSQPNPTDIYIAEAWTNRGPYGQEPDYRAKGRVNIMRPPYTGLSVLLKEEKTRTREEQEKEAKAIRKRMGKNMWTQLPDRPVVRQSQQVLW